jgi:hypothetical protein
MLWPLFRPDVSACRMCLTKLDHASSDFIALLGRGALAMIVAWSDFAPCCLAGRGRVCMPLQQVETAAAPQEFSSQHPPQFVWFISH